MYVYKGGDMYFTSNYGPMTLLWSLSKVIEKNFSLPFLKFKFCFQTIQYNRAENIVVWYRIKQKLRSKIIHDSSGKMHKS